jgi:hypothetical protein
MFMSCIDELYIEDYLCMFLKKFIPISSLCSAGRHRDSSLAAATAAATALAFSTPAVIEHIDFVHGFHLLSYRCLSIDLVKKIGGSARLLSNLIG